MNFDAFIKKFYPLCITLVANLCLAKLKTWDVTPIIKKHTTRGYPLSLILMINQRCHLNS